MRMIDCRLCEFENFEKHSGIIDRVLRGHFSSCTFSAFVTEFPDAAARTRWGDPGTCDVVTRIDAPTSILQSGVAVHEVFSKNNSTLLHSEDILSPNRDSQLPLVSCLFTRGTRTRLQFCAVS